MHEMPGMTPECIRWAEEVVSAGFTVYLPLFFGKPNRFSLVQNAIQICIRKEIHFLSNNKSGPITDWLRALCDFAYDECNANSNKKYPGIGAIGMCMSGGFALALIQKPTRVVAPVLSQPSMPIMVPFSSTKNEERKCSLGVCNEAIEDTKEFCKRQLEKDSNFRLPVLRFEEDLVFSPKEKMERLRSQLPEGVIVPDDGSDDQGRISTISKQQRQEGKIPWYRAHSVLTGYYGTCDAETDPTTRARQQVIDYLQNQLLVPQQ